MVENVQPAFAGLRARQAPSLQRRIQKGLIDHRTRSRLDRLVIVESAREVSIERGRLRVVLATIVINIVAVSLLVFAPWSNWRTGLALNLVDNCLLVGFALVPAQRIACAVSRFWLGGRHHRASR